MEHEYCLQIIFHEVLDPDERSARFDEPLDEALLSTGLGEVVGGGTGSRTSDTVVMVGDLKEGLKAVRSVLRKAKAPRGTTIVQTEPVGMQYEVYSSRQPPKRATDWSRSRVVSFRPGDIAAVPLENGLYGFVRFYQDAALGVFRYASEAVESMEDVASHEVAFFSGCYFPDEEGQDWIRIGRLTAPSELEEWPPPVIIRDSTGSGEVFMYHRGEMSPATEEEVSRLPVTRPGLTPPSEIAKRIAKSSESW